MAQQSARELYVFVSTLPDLPTLMSAVPVGGEILILDGYGDGVSHLPKESRGGSELHANRSNWQGRTGRLQLDSVRDCQSRILVRHTALAQAGDAISKNDHLPLRQFDLVQWDIGQAAVAWDIQMYTTTSKESPSTKKLDHDSPAVAIAGNEVPSHLEDPRRRLSQKALTLIWRSQLNSFKNTGATAPHSSTAAVMCKAVEDYDVVEYPVSCICNSRSICNPGPMNVIRRLSLRHFDARCRNKRDDWRQGVKANTACRTALYSEGPGFLPRASVICIPASNRRHRSTQLTQR